MDLFNILERTKKTIFKDKYSNLKRNENFNYQKNTLRVKKLKSCAIV